MTVHRSTTGSCSPARLKAAALRSKHEAFVLFFGFCFFFFIAVTKRGFYSWDPVQSGDPTAADVTGFVSLRGANGAHFVRFLWGLFRRGLRSCQKSISSRKTAFGVTFVSFRNGLSVGRQLIWKEAPGRVARRQIATSGLTESISALSPPLRCHLCLPLRPNLFFVCFCTTHKQLPCSAARSDRRANRTDRMLRQICRHQIFFFFFCISVFNFLSKKRRAVTNN